MTTSRWSRTFLVLVVVALTTAASLSVVASAGAATPCGKKVLGDWFDNGRIDRLYPYNCYEEAIDAIPPDIGPYSDAEDVITRALQSALDGHLAPGGKDPSPGDGSGSGNGANGGSGSGGSGSGGSGSPQAAPDVDTSGPSSVPIPLLVLGGMSVALLAAGGLGYVARRRHAAQADDDVGNDDTFV